jgi:hypothetical protein
VRRVRPAAARRCGPQAAALSACPLPAARRALHRELWGHPPQPGVARRDDPAVWSAWLSERPHSAASPVVHRDAAVRSSCCRRVAAEAWRPGVLPGPVRSLERVPSCQAPAAFHQPVEAAARAMASPSAMKAAEEAVVEGSSAQPVASAPQVRRPVEAVAPDAKVRPRAVAEGQPVASARQPGAAGEAAVSAAGGQPPEVAAGPGAEAVQPREAAEAVRDGAAALRLAGAAEEQPDAEVPQPAAECRASAVALPLSSRQGGPLRGLAPR